MSTLAELKKRRARRGEPLPEVSTLIVRADLLDPVALQGDAEDNYEIYGYWGISVFAEIAGFSLNWIAANKLSRAKWLVVFRADDVLASGLDLWDTGKSPHYDIVHVDLAELVARLVACQHRTIRNPIWQLGGTR